jgi:hypothetical protein
MYAADWVPEIGTKLFFITFEKIDDGSVQLDIERSTREELFDSSD